MNQICMPPSLERYEKLNEQKVIFCVLAFLRGIHIRNISRQTIVEISEIVELLAQTLHRAGDLTRSVPSFRVHQMMIEDNILLISFTIFAHLCIATRSFVLWVTWIYPHWEWSNYHLCCQWLCSYFLIFWIKTVGLLVPDYWFLCLSSHKIDKFGNSARKRRS